MSLFAPVSTQWGIADLANRSVRVKLLLCMANQQHLRYAFDSREKEPIQRRRPLPLFGHLNAPSVSLA